MSSTRPPTRRAPGGDAVPTGATTGTGAPSTARAAWWTRLGLFVAVSLAAGLVVSAAALPFVGGLGVTARAAVTNFEALPDSLATPPLPQRSVILAADGTRLATIYYQNRVEVPLGEIAPIMRKAVIASEDSRFYEHRGVDLRGTIRALMSNADGGSVQGGSTLTQQYVKNVLINSARNPDEAAAARAKTPIRKIRELRLALGVERRFSKDQILAGYLNISYFGRGAYGVQAAARRYFSKDASQLSIVEAATLAGAIQSPTAYDPTRHPAASEKRRAQVLGRMAAEGYISRSAAKAAAAIPTAKILKPSEVPNGCTASIAPYFCDYVVQVMRTNPVFGKTPTQRENLLRRGGLTIRTTLDMKAQSAAQTAVDTYIPRKDPSRKAAAITMLRPSDGAILAMAQDRSWGTRGRGYTTLNYNVDTAYHGVNGYQAGSTFKVFTLSAALAQGRSPYEPIQAPQDKKFAGFKNCTTNVPFPPYRVRNSTGAGTFNMLSGTAFSINTYFMGLEERIGQCQPADIAEAMGVRHGNGSPLDRFPSFTLGTDLVTPMAMAGAYATIANHGIRCTPLALNDVVDRNNAPVPVPAAQCKRVLDRDVADTVASILTGVVDGPLQGRTGAKMSLGRPAGGKTGTINDSAAVWFCGFTPDLAAAVWVGDPRGGQAHPMRDITIGGRYFNQVFGSSLPGPIWKQSMLGALDGTPPAQFDLTARSGLSAFTPADRRRAPSRSTAGNSPSPSASPGTSGTASPAPAPTATGGTKTPAPSPR